MSTKETIMERLAGYHRERLVDIAEIERLMNLGIANMTAEDTTHLVDLTKELMEHARVLEAMGAGFIPDAPEMRDLPDA